MGTHRMVGDESHQDAETENGRNPDASLECGDPQLQMTPANGCVMALGAHAIRVRAAAKTDLRPSCGIAVSAAAETSRARI